MFSGKFHTLFFAGIALTALLMAGLISCKKDNIGAPPIIEGVRVTNPAQKDSVFDKALPNTFIVIEGRNLAETKQILFNDFPATFNNAYSTDTHLFVNIPADTPTPDRFPEVPNTIKVITPHGEAVYTFTIVPPAPYITSIVNENPKPGTTMTVNGGYFFSVKEVVLPGDVIVTDLTKNSLGTQLSFTVPANLGAAPGKLTLKSQYGDATTVYEVNKMTGVGIISNFDNINNQAWGFTEVTDNADLFPNSTGKYLRNQFFNLQLAASDQWWLVGRHIVFNSTSVLDDAGKALLNKTDSAAKYALKFEINTKVAWNPAYVYRITFNEKYSYIYEPNLSVPSNIFYTENKWQTVTIPLNQFKEATKTYDQYPLKANGAAVTTLNQLFNANGAYTQLYFRSTVKSGVVIPEIHYAIDNVRVVRIAK